MPPEPLRPPLAELADSITQVPLVDGTSARFVNFDYAASAPPLASVHRKVSELMAYYASIHRGQSYLSRVSTGAYERARETIAQLTGARADDVVVFTRNTTDALTLLAGAVPGRVVHFDIEHHANLLPWRTGEWTLVPAQESFAASLAALEHELASAPAALVAVTGASNVTGECPSLAAVAATAHRHGARLAVDGAQLAPHRRVAIAADGIDYFACSGHKLYAPYGAGALIGRRDWLDASEPHQPGGGAVVRVTADDVEWKTSPARHEGGTPNLVGAVGLAAGLQAVHALNFDAIAEHEMALYDQLLDGLRELGIEVLRFWPGHERPRRGRQLHRARLPSRSGRRLPLGRAGDRRSRREVLRPSAARAARPRRRRCGAREHWPGHRRRGRRGTAARTGPAAARGAALDLRHERRLPVAHARSPPAGGRGAAPAHLTHRGPFAGIIGSHRSEAHPRAVESRPRDRGP